jgi:hypothetical protein
LLFQRVGFLPPLFEELEVAGQIKVNAFFFVSLFGVFSIRGGSFPKIK